MATLQSGTRLERPYSEAICLTSNSLFSKYNLYLAFVGGLIIGGSFLVSLDLSYILPAAVCDLQLTASSKAIMSSSVFVGTMSACHVSGLLMDILGRQYIIQRSLFLTTFLYVLTAFAPNFISFAVLKALTGFTMSPSAIAVFVYLGESCPEHMVSSVIITATTVASFIFGYNTAMAWLFLPRQWEFDLSLFVFHPWRLFTLFCGLPILITAILISMLPESPKFLLASGHKEKALKVIKNIYHINKGLPKKDFPVTSLADLPDEKVLPAKTAVDIFKRMWSQTFPLFLPPYLTKVLFCSFIYFIVFFCMNGILIWVPEMTNRMSMTLSNTPNQTLTLCEMMQPLVSLEDELLEPIVPLGYVSIPQINLTLINSSLVSNDNVTLIEDNCVVNIREDIFLPNLLLALVQPLCTMLAGFVTYFFKKKKLAMMLFLLINSLLLVSVTLVPNANIIIGIFTLLPSGFSVVYNVNASLIIDFFPTNYRGMAVSLAMLFGRSGAIVCNFAFSFMLDYNCLTLFYTYVGFIILSILVAFTIKSKHHGPTSPPADTSAT